MCSSTRMDTWCRDVQGDTANLGRVSPFHSTLEKYQTLNTSKGCDSNICKAPDQCLGKVWFRTVSALAMTSFMGSWKPQATATQRKESKFKIAFSYCRRLVRHSADMRQLSLTVTLAECCTVQWSRETIYGIPITGVRCTIRLYCWLRASRVVHLSHV